MAADLLITSQECADALGVSRRTIVALVESGEWIGARKIGERCIISRAAFTRLYIDGVWHADEATKPIPYLQRVSA